MSKLAQVGDFCPNEMCPDYNRLQSDREHNIIKFGKTQAGRQRQPRRRSLSGWERGPDYYSMERIDSLAPDSPANWSSNNGVMRNGCDANGNRLNGTPLQPNLLPIATPTPTPLPIASSSLLISELLYDAITSSTSGDEFVEVCNALAGPGDLTGFKVGRRRDAGHGGGHLFPHLTAVSWPSTNAWSSPTNAAQFAAGFGFYPNYELVVSGDGYADTLDVPCTRNLLKVKRNWAKLVDRFPLAPPNRVIDKQVILQNDWGRLPYSEVLRISDLSVRNLSQLIALLDVPDRIWNV